MTLPFLEGWRPLTDVCTASASDFTQIHRPASIHPVECPVADRDAHWRISWVEFDSSLSKVLARGNDLLITPPPRELPDDTDIAFAASAVDEPDNVALYYTVADRRLIRSMLKMW